jgi:hypothetical protein
MMYNFPSGFRCSASLIIGIRGYEIDKLFNWVSIACGKLNDRSISIIMSHLLIIVSCSNL